MFDANNPKDRMDNRRKKKQKKNPHYLLKQSIQYQNMDIKVYKKFNGLFVCIRWLMSHQFFGVGVNDCGVGVND